MSDGSYCLWTNQNVPLLERREIRTRLLQLRARSLSFSSLPQSLLVYFSSLQSRCAMSTPSRLTKRDCLQSTANPEMEVFIKTPKFDTPLEPYDGFFGGRTNAACLHKEISEDGKIHYVDFTSLYPWTNKYCEVPIGHPEILTSAALVSRSATEFFRMIMCEILPPSFLFQPVLPYRAQGKLMFTLCRSCAEKLQQTPCEQSEEQRALSGTWPSIKIAKACELGYRVVRLIEVWNFPETSSHLFKEYIGTFVKIKQEASGWPSWCHK